MKCPSRPSKISCARCWERDSRSGYKNCVRANRGDCAPVLRSVPIVAQAVPGSPGLWPCDPVPAAGGTLSVVRARLVRPGSSSRSRRCSACAASVARCAALPLPRRLHLVPARARRPRRDHVHQVGRERLVVRQLQFRLHRLSSFRLSCLGCRRKRVRAAGLCCRSRGSGPAAAARRAASGCSRPGGGLILLFVLTPRRGRRHFGARAAAHNQFGLQGRG